MSAEIESTLMRRIKDLESLIKRLSTDINEHVLTINFRIDDLQSDLRHLEESVHELR